MPARPRPWWLPLTLVPFGWTAWVGILYAGVSARRRARQALGVVFLGLAVATWVWSDGAFIVSTWIVGLGAGMLIAPAWRREVRASGRLGLEGARDRLHTRAEARRIAAEQPRSPARSRPPVRRSTGSRRSRTSERRSGCPPMRSRTCAT